MRVAMAVLACWVAYAAGLRAAAAVRPRLAASQRARPLRLADEPPQYGAAPPLLPAPPPASFLQRAIAVARAAKAAWRSPETVSAAILPPSERRVGLGFILSYLWPEGAVWRARARVAASLALLVIGKLFIVRVPFLFKRAIDSVADGGVDLRTGVAWMVAYGVSRAVYSFLQEGRYLLFTPVGQNALRRFTADSFAHVQRLDSRWLSAQSTGELSRVFARGMRGMNALLRLLVFNVGPTLLETALALWLLGQRYGGAFLALSLGAVTVFVGWSVFVVQRRVALIGRINDNDNALFTRLFNALLCNEAVRVNTNEDYEVEQYDALLGEAETLACEDVATISLLNAGQAIVYWGCLGATMALCATRVAAGRLTIGDAVAINGLLIQLHSPLTALGYTYQEIRQAYTDMRQLLALLRKIPRIRSAPDAPPLPHLAQPAGVKQPSVKTAGGRVGGGAAAAAAQAVGRGGASRGSDTGGVPSPTRRGALAFERVYFGYDQSRGNLLNISFEVPPGTRTAIVGPSGSGKSSILKLILRLHDPDAGRVLIDGADVSRVSVRSLRQAVAFIPQDTILFDASARYNIHYGNFTASNDEIETAARRVGLLPPIPEGGAPRGGGAAPHAAGDTGGGGTRAAVRAAPAALRRPQAGGDTAGGTHAGGDTAGGTHAGGDTAGGTHAGGETVRELPAGADIVGGAFAGADTARGGLRAGSAAAGRVDGVAAAGDTLGGAVAAGETLGGAVAAGDTLGGAVAAGETLGGAVAAGDTSGGAVAADDTAGGGAASGVAASGSEAVSGDTGGEDAAGRASADTAGEGPSIGDTAGEGPGVGDTASEGPGVGNTAGEGHAAADSAAGGSLMAKTAGGRVRGDTAGEGSAGNIAGEGPLNRSAGGGSVDDTVGEGSRPSLVDTAGEGSVASVVDTAGEGSVPSLVDTAGENSVPSRSSLTRGLETRVGERGLAISGGERQRIAIARALLNRPLVVLCDEPTSALDPVTEASVQAVLDEAFRNVTTITVAHRLSSIVDYDQILVMVEGCLVERGTHASLLCADGVYSKMWTQQEGNQRGPRWMTSQELIPDYCELVDDDGIRASLGLSEIDDVLALRAIQAVDGRGQGRGGWLW